MGRLGVISILALIGAAPASAAELPARKPGLWEIKMMFENKNVPGQTIQQCIDASTDQIMQSNVGPTVQSACTRRDVQQSANAITIDSTCTVAGKATTTHAVITGSLDSSYTMTVTSDAAVPGGKSSMTMAAKWLGPCAAGQRPGDMIMPNGMKINVPDMQKRGIPPIPGRP